jgi:hypothetical protein
VPQLMMGLSTKEQERAIREATLVWHLRNNERASAEQIAERLVYGSVEALRRQLKIWGLPDWVLGEESETPPAKKVLPKKDPPRLRDVGPRKELPPAANAADLFKERLDALRESVDLLEHINEGLYGKYFGRTNVETASVLHAGHWTDDAVVSLPGTVARSPTEIEVTLIGVYALAGGRMDLLLEKLHLDPSSVDTRTREKIRQCIEGSRADRVPKTA